MAALDAVARLLFQLVVMVLGQRIPGLCQIVIFVDQAHIQSGRTGLAVVAVDAGPCGVFGRKGAQHRVIPLFGRSLQKAQHPLQVLPVPDAGQHGEDPRLIQRVLDALVFGEGLAKGGGLGVQQLAAAEGFHHRNAHPFCLAPAVEGHALFCAADGVVAVVIVVARVDAEHQQVQNAQVQSPLHHPGRVGAHADVAHRAFPLQLLDVSQHAVVQHFLQVRLFIQAVEKAKIDVIGLQGFQLPADRPFDGVQVRGPAVFAALVVGAEMDLEMAAP